MRRSTIIALKLFVCAFAASAGPRELALQHNMKGIDLHAQARYAEAEDEYRKAIALQLPFNPAEASLYAATLNNLGGVLQLSGKNAEAQKLFNECIALEPLLGADRDPILTNALNSLALTHHLEMDLSQAERLLKRSLSVSPNDGAPRAGALHNLGAVYFDMGKLKQAQDLFTQALAIDHSQRLHGAIPPTLTYLSRIAAARGDTAKAEDLLRQAVNIRRDHAPRSPELAIALSDMGELQKDLKDYPQAAVYLEECLEILDSLLGKDHLVSAPALFQFGEVRRIQGRYEEALHFFERTARILERSFGPNHVRLANVYRSAGETSRKLKRKDQAKQYDQRAKALQANRVEYEKHSIDVNAFLPVK